MNRIFVHGCGAVSPAGWGMEPLREAVAKGMPLPVKQLARPGWTTPLPLRQTPPPPARPGFLTHARLRRTSPIAQYIVAAALEALGNDAPLVAEGKLRLGVVSCVMAGCVNYSRRFYDEALRDPATASPLLFPETVFNAPASHLSSILGAPAMNYTLVGDPGTFLQGLALAAQWLEDGQVDACLVVGGEECDWLTSDAFRLFTRRVVLGDGAGALYLKAGQSNAALAELQCISDSHLYLRGQGRAAAARKMRAQLPRCFAHRALFDGRQGMRRLDAAETAAWRDWTGGRFSPKLVLGEALTAAAAWQCALAVDAFRHNGYTAASVSVVGCNQQAIGAHFVKPADATSP